MKIKIQGEIEMTIDDFEKLGMMLITKQSGFEVTYRGVAIQKAWLPKRVMKQYKTSIKTGWSVGDCFACKYEYNASGLHKGEPCNQCFYVKARPNFEPNDRFKKELGI